jgi:hypothetical protein
MLLSIAFFLKQAALEYWLGSWVQIPPGPFLSVVQIRYYLELVLSSCRTNSAAMPMPYPIFVRHCLKKIVKKKKEDDRIIPSGFSIFIYDGS